MAGVLMDAQFLAGILIALLDHDMVFLNVCVFEIIKKTLEVFFCAPTDILAGIIAPVVGIKI